ncbi:hypothetical protein BASA81_000482 [Batrachochytrium salamandrivorans]|nr:hypothetical protein BASA81_000482 [Batrachochytrium salamandrivorans]
MACPPPLTLVGMPPPLHDFLLSTIVLFPTYVLGCFLCFYANRNSSVFLRKRPLVPLALSLLGTIVPWLAFSVYDFMDPSHIPCWVFKFLCYLTYVMLIVPTILKLAKYRNDRARQLLQDAMQKMSPTDLEYIEFGEGMLNGEVSFRTVWAHLQMTMCPSRPKSRRVKILNARFCNSHAFVLLWFGFTGSPFLIGFIIAVSTNPTSLCMGCEMEPVDLGFMLALAPLVFGIGFFTLKSQREGNDPLRIVQECLGVWAIAMTSIVGWLLLLTDPGQIQGDNQFRWRIILLFTVAWVVYYQTVHQVIMSKSFKLRQELLISNTFNYEERFQDIMANKWTKRELRRHMNGELSSEIIDFLEAVQQFKIEYTSLANGGVQLVAASEIYDTFVKRGARREVNLSYAIREATTQALMEQGKDISFGVFDAAYDTVKRAFLADGFPRFLKYLKAEPVSFQTGKRIENNMVASPQDYLT